MGDKEQNLADRNPPEPRGTGRDHPPGDDSLFFSRNLELSHNAPPPGSSSNGPPSASSEMSAADREMYFRVEAGKILEILRQELACVTREPPAAGLVQGLLKTWRTLWQGDNSYPVGAFTAMFEIASSILLCVSQLARSLSAQERGFLGQLVQAMADLAAQDSPPADSGAYQALMDQARPVARFLKEQCAEYRRSRYDAPDQLGGPATGDKPAESFGGAPPAKPAGDISGSVDEWFSQVAHLVAGPSGNRKEESVESCPGPGPKTGDAVPAAPSIPPAAAAQHLTRENRAESLPPDSSLPEDDKQPAFAPRPAPQTAHTAPQELVAAYFRECCGMNLAVLHHQLDLLRQRTAKKTLRLVSGYLEEMQRLCSALEIDSCLGLLDGIRGELEGLGSAAAEKEESSRVRIVDRMGRLIRELEAVLDRDAALVRDRS